MTKREIVWLIIRLVGVYFIFQAVLSAWDLIAILAAFFSDVAKMIYAGIAFSSVKVMIWTISMLAFYGFLGWYFVKDGSKLYEILYREDRAEKSDNSSTLNLSDEA